jgi:hypothetical protein
VTFAGGASELQIARCHSSTVCCAQAVDALLVVNVFGALCYREVLAILDFVCPCRS